MGDDTRCIMTFNKHLWVFFVAFFSPFFSSTYQYLNLHLTFLRSAPPVSAEMSTFKWSPSVLMLGFH